MTPAKRDAILKAFREHIAKPEVQAQILREAEEYAAYMQLPEHAGGCHCVRCMREFTERHP